MPDTLAALRAHWFVACTSEELQQRPLARTILGTPLVLFRSEKKACALLDRCPHRNAMLSQGRVVQGLIQCPYHGWTFDGAGACQSIPGRPTGPSETFPHQHAEAVNVEEREGLIWVHLTAANAIKPELPRWQHPSLSDPAFDSFTWAATADCDVVDGIENLLDACHPHFTHSGLVRTAQRRREVTVTVRRTSEFAEAIYRENHAAIGIIPRLLEGKRKASIGRFFPPTTAQLDYVGEKGSQFLLTSVFTPCDARKVLIHSVISTPRGLIPAAVKKVFLRAIFGRVLRQDQDALRDQQANIDRFGGVPAFTSTPLDVMRPHILYFLTHPDPKTRSAYESTVKMEL